MRVLPLATLAILLLAGCSTPPSPSEPPTVDAPLELVAAHADPLADGPFAWTDLDYDLGATTIGGPDGAHEEYEYEHRLRGHLWVPEGAGPFPLAVFLHGQHTTCALMGDDGAYILGAPAVDDCDDDEGLNSPYRNDLGYGYLGSHLASHGIAVASILGHEVNNRNGPEDVGMWGRGELVLATIDAILAATPQALPDLAGKVDPARIGIMGHSRGGEGVVTAVHVDLARPADARIGLDAVVALAPTDFNGRPVLDIPLLALVPYCDGDVFSLHGLRTFDHSVAARHNRSVPLTQVLVMGADHNMYNTQWASREVGPLVEGDDAPPGRHGYPQCDLPRGTMGGKLSPADTLAEATLHIGGFLRWHLLGDASLAPYFTGALPTAPGACPGGAAQCLEAVHVAWQQANATTAWSSGDGMDDRMDAVGFASAVPCEGSACDATMYSAHPVVELAWTQESTLRVAGLSGLAGDVLTVRLALAPQAMPDQPLPRITVAVEANGTVASVELAGHPDVYFPPASPVPGDTIAAGLVGGGKIAVNQVRLPLALFDVDAQDVTAVSITFGAVPSGHAFVGDIAIQDEAALTVAAR